MLPVQPGQDLASLTPDIVRDTAIGRQLLGLTGDGLQRHVLPSDWDRQGTIVETL